MNISGDRIMTVQREEKKRQRSAAERIEPPRRPASKLDLALARRGLLTGRKIMA